MNFSLGNKEAIVNSSKKYPVTTDGTELHVEGYGTFLQANIITASAQRFKPGKVGGLTITAPTAAELGIEASDINVPITTHIRVNTTRHTSEWATDFIKRGRPFIFELIVNGTGLTSTIIATKLVEAFTEYEAKFNMSDSGLPFTWIQDGADVTLELKSPYLSFQKTVDFLPKGTTYGVKAVTTDYIPLVDATETAVTVNAIATTGASAVVLTDTDPLSKGESITLNGDVYTITAINVNGTGLTVSPVLVADLAVGDAVTVQSLASEPTYDGKYLEENVRMSTAYTSDSYGISPDEKPFISGEYTTITFEMKSDANGGIGGGYAPHRNMGGVANEQQGSSVSKFSIYVLDGSDVYASGGTVEQLYNFLAASGDFLKANGEVAADLADFIA